MTAVLPRRLALALVATLLAVIVAHSALWWWVTGEMQRQVAATLAASPPGWQISAGVPRRGGWPLAATVEVPDLSATAPVTPTERLHWQAEQLTVSLALARPRTLVLDVDGRQAVRFGTAPLVPFTAARMRAETPLDPGPVRSTTLEVAGLAATLPDGPFAVARLDLRTEGRPAAQPGEVAAALAVTARQITLPPGRAGPLGPEIALLAFEIAVSGPVPPNPDLAARAEAWRDGGGQVTLKRLELAWGEVTLAGTATLALDPLLQPAGSASARLGGHPAALRALTASGVLTPRNAVAAGAVLGLMARPPAQGGPPVVEVPFTLQDRTLALGRIPLTRVPELIWRPPS